MKKKYSYRGLVKQAFSYINTAVHKGYKLGKVKEDLRELVNSYSGLNRDERYKLYDTLYTLARASKSSTNPEKYLSLRKNFDEVVRISRKVKASSELRAKKQAAYQAMHTEGIIFFLCSWHPNPAEDHKDYAGRIFIDRFWRSKVKGREYYAVSSYVKNHNILTIQEIMGEPVYLSTRPYCRHYFIGLDTGTVLHNSRNKLVKEYGMTYEKGYDVDEYYKLRSSVYSKLNKDTPCKEYAGKISYRA